VPIVSGLSKKRSWNDAVDLTVSAVKPLGEEYAEVLENGLTKERWSDRYPNTGKHSGAFSSGGYDSKPYILMNYQEEILDHVFTLAHEAGHSMHSYYATKTQPFQYYNYTIFTRIFIKYNVLLYYYVL
jgi:oligoendopeptidase F